MIMIEARISQFKVVLALLILLAVSIGGYMVWALVDFNSHHALSESRFLARFTERAASRYRVNPQLYFHDSEKTLGNNRVNLAPDYENLRAKFHFLPQHSNFVLNTTRAVLINYRGFFKVPNYLLVRPVRINDQVVFGYLLVDERLNDSALDFRVLEKVQPAIFAALFCILLLVLVELYHINKVNANINEFALWASQLSAGVNKAPMPAFAASKFNYLAFAIDKSLASISHVLEEEQSFAKFTSHELRTPIAVLSANMELLELLMKDLSPQERKVLKNMESAVSDMKYQMEALLWLSKEGESDVEFSLCSLRELLVKALNDNVYLLEGKNVTVTLQGDAFAIQSNPVFLQIILNNLVRNAYQHTDKGAVNIQLAGNSVLIENSEAHGQSESSGSVDIEKSIGFGIGLALVEKLVRKLDINYAVENFPHGRCVQLIFH